jgi:hypothetical protein
MTFAILPNQSGSVVDGDKLLLLALYAGLTLATVSAAPISFSLISVVGKSIQHNSTVAKSIQRASKL